MLQPNPNEELRFFERKNISELDVGLQSCRGWREGSDSGKRGSDVIVIIRGGRDVSGST